MSDEGTPGEYYSRRLSTSLDWISQLNGYELRLWAYTHECSRLTLRATDTIAKRPAALLILHDVSYIEMPLLTGKVRAREATDAEVERVRAALGPNFLPSNVLAICATGKRTFLVEYGFTQWLTATPDDV